MNIKNEETHISVLHVLTLFSDNGDYGGPSTVAKNLCERISLYPVDTALIAGYRHDKAYNPFKNKVKFVGVRVKPISSKFQFSSLWGRGMFKTLFRHIKNADVIHIHFARELIPVVASILCLILRKAYILQSHGMIEKDSRKFVAIFDRIFTKIIIARSKGILVLTELERAKIVEISSNSRLIEFPNGIEVESEAFLERQPNVEYQVAFLGRLHPNKALRTFLDVALNSARRGQSTQFDIYGPDAGELPYLRNFISVHGLQNTVFYRGTIEHRLVKTMLASKDLLIVPSKFESFSMVALEALSTGCPVLVTPGCAISPILKDYDPLFVSHDASPEAIFNSLNLLMASNRSRQERLRIIEFARLNFSLDAQVKFLYSLYRELV